jgi:hypothetical protein
MECLMEFQKLTEFSRFFLEFRSASGSIIISFLLKVEFPNEEPYTLLYDTILLIWLAVSDKQRSGFENKFIIVFLFDDKIWTSACTVMKIMKWKMMEFWQERIVIERNCARTWMVPKQSWNRTSGVQLIIFHTFVSRFIRSELYYWSWSSSVWRERAENYIFRSLRLARFFLLGRRLAFQL